MASRSAAMAVSLSAIFSLRERTLPRRYASYAAELVGLASARTDALGAAGLTAGDAGCSTVYAMVAVAARPTAAMPMAANRRARIRRVAGSDGGAPTPNASEVCEPDGESPTTVGSAS